VHEFRASCAQRTSISTRDSIRAVIRHALGPYDSSNDDLILLPARDLLAAIGLIKRPIARPGDILLETDRPRGSPVIHARFLILSERHAVDHDGWIVTGGTHWIDHDRYITARIYSPFVRPHMAARLDRPAFRPALLACASIS